VKVTPEKAEALIRELPDPAAARNFLDTLRKSHPRAAKKLHDDAGLFADVVALVAWSPLLATTLAQNPEYITWLSRVRKRDVLRSGLELIESLGRFQGTHSQLTPHDLLSRFRRRELLRIYLQDIRRTGTVSEITEELSHLADAILTFALRLARQEMENRYGPPRLVDEGGRITPAEVAVVALGKLGSNELNFASDIDLMFIFSGEGTTAGGGEREPTSNREFFNRLARAVVQMVADQSGEGAAYRVDLRLRPYGREGTLASSVVEAVRYYALKAQAWELQALIRSRCAAGSIELFADFIGEVSPHIYSPHHTWQAVAESNAEAKRKIDEKVGRGGEGFNVKLGRGGIREIEFVAQSLGMALGGNDPWLRSPHTLIALGRLEERKLISTQERIELFEAYEFLRTLEHRLQMEHGLQTHQLPVALDQRRLVARRMGFDGPDALAEFDASLARQTANVKRIFDQVMALPEFTATVPERDPPGSSIFRSPVSIRDDGVTLPQVIRAVELPVPPDLASVVVEHLIEPYELEIPAVFEMIERSLDAYDRVTVSAILARLAASLNRSEVHVRLSPEELRLFFHLVITSEYFAEMFCASPGLIGALEGIHREQPSYEGILRNAVAQFHDFSGRIGAFRREWAACLVRIGALDALRAITMREANRRQTALAEASLDIACDIALAEMIEWLGSPAKLLRFGVFGLGRLGGSGMDYGSDLDIVIIYDEDAPELYPEFNCAEIYSRVVEHIVKALSSLTRDGYLYRVDLRLRPDGRNGPVCSGARAFLDYLRQRSQPWEWLAYVKLRAAAGDVEWAGRIEAEARSIIHDRAAAFDAEALREETRRVRNRLETEKSLRGKGLDIKYSAGGMLDVYFAVRYLQLRYRIPDQAANRSTLRSLQDLLDAGALTAEDHTALSEGYAFLRELDHRLRLSLGRFRRLPGLGHPVLEQIARDTDLPNAGELTAQIEVVKSSIRRAYQNIVG
jgi:glutamate-ammonia-ligase adenylyltransferase